MRIFNKMKKTMLVLAASLFCAGSVFAETKSYLVTWGNVTHTATQKTDENPSTLTGNTGDTAEGIVVKLTGNNGKDYSSGTNKVKVPWNGETVERTTIKLSNKAQNTVFMPEGWLATKVTFYSYVNHAADKREKALGGSSDNTGFGYRSCYWKEVAGKTYTAETGTLMNVFVDGIRQSDNSITLTENAYKNPDAISFDLDKVSSFTFNNDGEQVCLVLVIEAEAEAAAPALDLTACNEAIAWANAEKAKLNAEDETEAMVISEIDNAVMGFQEMLENLEEYEITAQEELDNLAARLKEQIQGYIDMIPALKLQPVADQTMEEGWALYDSYPEDIRTDEAGLATALQALRRSVTQENIDAVKAAMVAFKAENDANVAGGAGAATEKVYATFEKPTNTNAIWDAATKSFTWTQSYYNQIRNIGLPNGDITKYAKLVVDCEIVSGTQFRILFYKQDGEAEVNKALFVTKSGVTEINIVEELQKLGDDYMSFLTECKEICLSGSGDAGEVKINSMYLETAPVVEEPEVPAADSLKIGEVSILEVGKTYVLGKSYEMYKVQFTAEKDGFLSITPSQKVSNTNFMINGASSTFTKVNGGIEKKGMAAGSVFTGTFYCTGTPSAENVYELVVTFEEGTPYSPLALTLANPVDGGEWSGAAQYKTYGTKGVPHYEFSTLIGTDVKASVKIGETVYENIKLTVDGYNPKLDITALPDTLNKAIAAGLIKAGETFTLTLSNIVDKEFAANTLADQTFTYTLASTACTGVSPTPSTTRTIPLTDVTFSFDGKVALADTAKFYMLNLFNNEVTELTGEVVEETSVKITIPAIDGLLPRKYNIVAEGVTDAEGKKVITYGTEPGKLVASYGTGNGFFKAVTSLQNWGQVYSLKGFTATYPGAVIKVDGIATKPITFVKVNTNTGEEEEMADVTLSYTISEENPNVIEFALSKPITELGTYRFSVPQKHFWAKDAYDEEDAKLSGPLYSYYQASITLTIDVVEPTATDVTDKLVNPNFDDANANTGWNAGSKDLGFGVSPDAKKLKYFNSKIFSGNIVEHWEANAWTGDIAQAVKELPAGTYKFTLGAYVRETGKAYVYANDSLSGAIVTGIVDEYPVYVELAEGAELKVGVKYVDAIQWTCLDNAHLYYYGEGTTVNMAYKADVDAAIKAAEALKSSYATPVGVDALDAVTSVAKYGTYEETLASLVAIENAVEAFKQANALALIATATKSDSIDVTFTIVNPVANDNLNGWTLEGNTGMRILTGEHYSGVGENPYFDTNNWGASIVGSMKQTIKNLPAGVYTLTAAARGSMEQGYVVINDNKVAIQMIAGEGGTLGRGWNKYTVSDTLYAAGDITIGLELSNANSAKWFSADDFALSAYMCDEVEAVALLGAAVDSLNVLIAEVEAYQKTLDLTDPMQNTMNGELTTAIADAKAVAEAKESADAVNTARGQLNSVYVSVIGGIAGAEVIAAEEVYASYQNPSDNAGLKAAIDKVYEIYSYIQIGMGETAYTIKDLADAVEAMKVAKEAFIKENASVTEVSVSLTHTASSYCETDANAYVSTVDAEKEHINNSKFSGTWQGAAYAEFSVLLPEGISIKSATLTWSGIGSSKDRTTDIMYVNAGETLDYETMKSTGTEKVNLPATNIATVTFKASKTNDFTTDVTEAVNTIIGSGQNYIIFKFTNNVGAGDLVGKGAAEKAPVLTLETVDASMMTTYTVAYVDEAGVELKPADVYSILIGETATLAAENKAAIYNEDNTKKYIYASCDKESITTVADSASNVITATFREAAKYNYTVETTDDSGSLAITMGSYSGFEGENVKAPYYAYVLNEADSTLYESAKNNKEYNKYVDLTQDNMKVQVAYTPTTIKNVVYYQEAENVEGLTKITTGNTAIRSSNSASAYAADADVVLTTLAPGKYKLAAVIYDATKALNSEFSFIAGSDTILKAVSTAANWTNCVSEEFTLTANTAISLAKGGSSSKGVDLFYIQKTGDVELPAKVAYLCGATETTEAIYTALVEAGYGVTPLNYDEVTLTEEVVANDFVGKYDVVVLAGATGSSTNLAATHNLLIGKVNVLSTKAFWYKKTSPAGTNGSNPGAADAPSTSLVKVAGYEEHPIYAGIEGAEFAVFNESEAITNGRYFQGNGALSGIEQATVGTTNGANCIGEAWVDGKGWMIIPVDGDNSANFSLTADGAQLFVNAVDYLIAGEQFEYNLVEGVRVEATQWPADIYDLSGRMIKKAATSLEGLDKGLYIINGKKYLVK